MSDGLCGLQRIRAEYQEMPGLRLTSAQVSRLCGIDSTSCESLLDALVQSCFLERAGDGRYGRPAEARAVVPMTRWGRPELRRA